MAHREYLIHFPNGFKQHVSSVELAAMDGLVHITAKEYRAPAIEQANGPSYLPGNFIIERKGKRERERLETPKAQIARLEAMGWQSEALV